MDVRGLHRAERRETEGRLWEARPPELARASIPAARRDGPPVQVNAPGPTEMARFLNGSIRKGSTPEGLKFWLGEG